jgi:hypothetical protein
VLSWKEPAPVRAPIVLISGECMYPSPTCFSWRVCMSCSSHVVCHDHQYLN